MNTKLAQVSFVFLVLLSSILGPAEIAHAQLDEHCTVSILNRTARVKADGSWRIPNIPARSQRVRARATCVENGQTRGGQSSFVAFAAGTTNAFDADISLTAPEPVPANVTLTATAVKVHLNRNLLIFQQN